MKERIANIGALISAALASICCLGPIVLVGIGLGGAGLAIGLAKYRPFFLALTAVLLGAATYFTYRKREVVCAGGRCEWRSGSRRMKASLWLITGIVLVLATFPNWSPFILRGGTAPMTEKSPSLTLMISGMHCAACAVSIESSLKNVPGVQSASVDFDRAEAVISIDTAEVKEEALLKAVEEAGPYKAVVVKNESDRRN